jgi:hypothetical protein
MSDPLFPHPPEIPQWTDNDRPQVRLRRSDLTAFSPFALTALIFAIGFVFPAASAHRPSAPWASTAIVLLLFAHLPLTAFLLYVERVSRSFILLLSVLAFGASSFACFVSGMSIQGEWM